MTMHPHPSLPTFAGQCLARKGFNRAVNHSNRTVTLISLII